MLLTLLLICYFCIGKFFQLSDQVLSVRVQAYCLLRFKRKQEMTSLMSVFIQQVKFIYLLVISAAIWLISIGLYWMSLGGEWDDNSFMGDMKEGIPYFLSTFELITCVGFAVVFSHLYKELKMLPDKTFERIKYKTMTYLTLITILTNTRFLYNLTLMINNSFT